MVNNINSIEFPVRRSISCAGGALNGKMTIRKYNYTMETVLVNNEIVNAITIKGDGLTATISPSKNRSVKKVTINGNTYNHLAVTDELIDNADGRVVNLGMYGIGSYPGTLTSVLNLNLNWVSLKLPEFKKLLTTSEVCDSDNHSWSGIDITDEAIEELYDFIINYSHQPYSNFDANQLQLDIFGLGKIEFPNGPSLDPVRIYEQLDFSKVEIVKV